MRSPRGHFRLRLGGGARAERDRGRGCWDGAALAGRAATGRMRARTAGLAAGICGFDWFRRATGQAWLRRRRAAAGRRSAVAGAMSCACEWAAGNGGRRPACQNAKICSRRSKMRVKIAAIRACRAAGTVPRPSFDGVVARKPASWSAKGEECDSIQRDVS